MTDREVATLRAHLERVQTQLYDVRTQKDRLQYEIDTIHHKNGTYRIVCHLRNEIQRLTISKLILIQSTALEMDRLRTIIRSLSRGEHLNDISINNVNEYSQTQILNDLLPPPTPTSPPPNFSWKETFNIDLNEDDIVGDGNYNENEENLNKLNNNKLDVEDDIKIPEMNLDLEDGAIKPISLLHHQSDIEDDDDSSENENESNDENGYVIERVASPEHGHNNYNDDDSENEFEENSDNVQIAIAEKKPLFADNYDIMNSDDMAEHNNNNNLNVHHDHHIHDDSCNHHHHHQHLSHDASPQLQFAGDGDDLNQIHGVATDAPILPPSTDGDIYGEEDHKFVISIQNVENDEQDDEKLQLVNLEEDELDDTHALISPKGDKNNKNNVLLQNENDNMENLELISEMGDDDRNLSASPNIENSNRGISPSPIAMEQDQDENRQKTMVPRIKIAVQEASFDDDDDEDISATPDQIYNDRLSPDIDSQSQQTDDMNSNDDEEEEDEFEYSLSASLMVLTPTSRIIKSHAYDVSTEIFNNPSIEEDDNNNKPRRPSSPEERLSARARSLSLSDRNVPLLNGLRLGEMEVHIGICEISDLIHLLSLICRSMTLLPFGLKEFRNKLSYTLQKRMCNSYELSQHFTFFLNSYRDCFAISRLFRDHICMESIIEIQRLNNLVAVPSGGHIRSASNNKYIKNTITPIDDDQKIPSISENLLKTDNVQYSGSNVVEFFRLPFIYPSLNQQIMATQCTEFVCPITGNKNVERLVIRKIYKSNAKPLLIDCYLRDKYTPISSFILKYGDDLRRDASVLMMFKFMNNLWMDNSCRYNNKQIAALTYKCYPLGPDYGIIELIPNCQTLKDITDKYVVNNKKKQIQKLSDDVINNIIATCAGSFMAAYIMGIRDRHYDNVLITESGTIFHIDFGYMLGEKVSGIDTSKFAITSDLSKLMGKKWKDFVDISVECWVILRENHQELLDFAKLAFSFLYPQETVQEFLKETLLLSLSVELGKKKIHKRLLQAPKKLKTKMKNWVHSVASARDRSSSGSFIDNNNDKIIKKENKNIFSSFLAPKRKSKSIDNTSLID